MIRPQPKPAPREKKKPKPMKRGRWQRQLPKRLHSEEHVAERAYLDAVKRGPQPCAAYMMLEVGAISADPCDGPMDPHHAGRRPGTALLCPAEEAIKMCRKHHRAEERATGVFAGWSKARRRLWRDRKIAETQALMRRIGFEDLLDLLLERTAAKADKRTTLDKVRAGDA